MTSPSTGLVLSGGGARGAYEAGVLRWIARELPGAAVPEVRFDILAGTSVGAINGAFLAAQSTRPCHGGGLLADLWASVRLEHIYVATGGALARMLGGVVGLGSGGDGAVLDSRPLQRFVRDRIDWKALAEARRARAFKAVAVTATEVATSRNVVFVDGVEVPDGFWSSKNPFVRARSVELSPEHVLASAAIPLLFPSVQADGSWFIDGGLGQQTPLRPALWLGAERLLILSLRQERTLEGLDDIAAERGDEAPGWAQIAGKTLNALLLDTASHEVKRMQRLNELLQWGEEEFGAGFTQKVGDFLAPKRGAPWRVVEPLLLTPTEDLGRAAIDYVLGGHVTSGTGLTPRMLRTLADAGSASENDLLSYLLFDPGYIDHLITLGERDAAAKADELAAFFSAPAGAASG